MIKNLNLNYLCTSYLEISRAFAAPAWLNKRVSDMRCYYSKLQKREKCRGSDLRCECDFEDMEDEGDELPPALMKERRNRWDLPRVC